MPYPVWKYLLYGSPQPLWYVLKYIIIILNQIQIDKKVKYIQSYMKNTMATTSIV